MMKRIITILLACLMVLNLTACNKDKIDAEFPSDASVSGDSSDKTGLPYGEAGVLPGIAKGNPPPISGAVNVPADYAGTPGVDFKELPVGDGGGWGSIPAPAYDPAGGFARYTGVEYEPDKFGGGQKTQYLDLAYNDGYAQVKERMKGALWTYSLPLSDDYADYNTNWLVWRARQQGFELLGVPGLNTCFIKREKDKTIWVQTSVYDNKELRVSVLSAQALSTGQSFTIDTKAAIGDETYLYYDYSSDDSRDEYRASFYTRPTPGKLQSITVTIEGAPDSGVRLYADTTIEGTALNRQISFDSDVEQYTWEISAKRGNTFIFDNVPVTEGELHWFVYWRNLEQEEVVGRGNATPDKVTIALSDIADIPAVKWGEALGQLKVEGVTAGSATITPQAGIAYEHDELFAKLESGTVLRGVKDQHGDTYFTLPAGYYTLEVKNLYGWNGDYISRDQLIPVSAGEVTTVTLPEEYSVSLRVIDQALGGGFEDAEGTITIQKAEVKGDSAELTLIVSDPAGEREISPKKEDFKITENGAEGEVTSLTRSPAANNVVLVLDSSGSMGENMQPAVDAAKRFVETLPEETDIQLIQFQQVITQHEGHTRAEALANLDKVKEGGGTALYDATAQALKILAGAERPYVVVFSDGADSRELTGMGKGSDLNKLQILEQIAAAGACVLTIGFGEGHDPAILIEMSGASQGGQYFAADDETQLETAFGAVARKFGNQYTLTYKRPVLTRNIDSDIPVLSFMIDCSGSMNMEPGSGSGDDVDYRIYKVRSLMHEFIGKIPAGTLMQMSSFRTPQMHPPVMESQLTTDKKAGIYAALGSMFAEGGTPIIEALNKSYEDLNPVPSTKRILVFFTDAALSVPEEQQGILDQTLERFRRSGIRTVFIGYGSSDYASKYEDTFKTAADKTGGDYLITDDLAAVGRKLDEVLKRLDNSNRVSTVTLNVSLDTAVSESERLTAAGSVTPEEGFTLREAESGKVVKPTLQTLKTGDPFIQYDRDGAQLLYGGDGSVTQRNANDAEATRILARFPLDEAMAASNTVGSLTAHEIYTMDLFKGIPIPYGCWVALKVSISVPEDSKYEAYEIPSIFNHFYLSVNNVAVPASKATWLAETPLAVPGNPCVHVDKGKTVEGMLVFQTEGKPTDEFKQISLHFYDSDYGHMTIPIAGKASEPMQQIEKLPSTAPVNIADSFSLTVSGLSDIPELAGVKTAGGVNAPEATSFRLAEASFDSKVEALLDLVPQDRLLLEVDTDQGPLLTKMNNLVYTIPLGFHGETMLAPGSVNPVRMPYEIANGLAEAPSRIIGDIQNGSLNIPLSQGTPYATGTLGKTFSHEYFDLKINALQPIADDSWTIALDFTMTDKKDGTGFGSLETLFLLERDISGMEAQGGDDSLVVDSSGRISNITAGSVGLGNFGVDQYIAHLPQGMAAPDMNLTQDYLYGAVEPSGTWGVFDGHTRRGLMFFTLPEDGKITDWSLTSPFMAEMAVAVSAEAYSHAPLLAKRTNVERDDSFQKKLDAKVSEAVALYKASHAAVSNPMDIDGSIEGKQVTPPAITAYGTAMLEAVKNDEDFLNLMYSLRWLGRSGASWYIYYAPEAVITQGWGTTGDLTWLAKDLLTRLGYKTELRQLRVTDVGKENLDKFAGYEVDSYANRDAYLCYGIYYTDSKGAEKCFVVPFMRDASELVGLCSVIDWDSNNAPTTSTAIVQVYAQYMAKPTDTASIGGGGLWGGLTDATAGGESGEYPAELLMLQEELPLDLLSKGVIDIGFASSKSMIGDRYLAYMNTVEGIRNGTQNIPADAEILGAYIKVEVNNDSYSHVLEIPEEAELDKYIFTLGLNLPDLTSSAASMLFAMSEKTQSSVDDPEPYSIVQFYNRNILNNFVAAQSSFDLEASESSGLVLGRVSKPRVLMVQSQLTKRGGLTTWIDLIQPFNEIHAGDEALCKGYSAASGLYMSQLESVVFPPGTAVGYLNLWAGAPEGTTILNIPVIDENGGRDDTHDAMAAVGIFPQTLLDVVKQNEKFIMVQSLPTYVNGEPYFAWLEIDPKTYETISVFSNGYHASMGEMFTMVMLQGEKTLQYVKGAWIGVNVSVWAVAAYSLEYDDYDEINASAKAMAVQVGGILAEFMGNVEKYSKMGNDGLDGLSEKAAEEANKMAKEAGMMDGDDPAPGERMPGPGNGTAYDPRKFDPNHQDSVQGEEEGDIVIDNMDDIAKKSFDILFEKLPKFNLFGVSVNDRIKEGLGFSQGYQDAVTVYFH